MSEKNTVLLIGVSREYRRYIKHYADDEGLSLEYAETMHAVVPEGDYVAIVSEHNKQSDFIDYYHRLCMCDNTINIIVLGDARDEYSVRAATKMPLIAYIKLPAPADIVGEKIISSVLSVQDTAYEKLIPELCGESTEIRHLREDIVKLSSVNSTVLITGETGVGKGVVTKAIHRLSSRSCSQLIHVDCSALSPSVMESELYGHERGAFTGAVAARKGRFELAQKGTLFLDEIGELDPAMQSKFLRALEEKVYERVGGEKSYAMTARIIAATSRDLDERIQQGEFRRDLYYRLNVIRFHMPALRERLSDIPLLVSSIVKRVAADIDIEPPNISSCFLERLMDHNWPGNIRELANVLERAMVLSRQGHLKASSLDTILGRQDFSLSQVVSRNDQRVPAEPESNTHYPSEKDMLIESLLAVGGNVARAARRIGMPRSTLRYKIKMHDLNYLLPTD